MPTFYTYVTEQCKHDADRHSVTADINRFLEKIEEQQSDRGLDHYPPPYRKRRIRRRGRLVIEEHRIDDAIVLCCARYFDRGSSEYEAFYRDTKGYYERNKVSQEEIEAYLTERRQKPIKQKTPLSTLEQTLLQPTVTPFYAEDGAYLESYDWFARISQDWAKTYLLSFYDLISEIENGTIPEGSDLITHPNRTNIRILFRHFHTVKRTILLAPIDYRNPRDEEELRRKYASILTADSIEIDELTRLSRRAYPRIIAYDEEIWLLVEKSVEANLALSPEEESILESVMGSPTGPKYPLFINGRPGSGKSTILQYLFAEQLSRVMNSGEMQQEDLMHPLYLTYSTPLLEQARSAVKNILICGSHNIEGGISEPNLVIDALLQTCFRNFREFLRSLLPSDIKGDFSHANYVDFNRFRKLWDSQKSKHPDSEVRTIGAELAWHAIRTFIKGMQHESGDVVDPEYYRIELARDAKSISDNTFEQIFDLVWTKWYEPLCRDENYWDDQDLARAVLTSSHDKLAVYPVVFCDESQDFTTIELELIQQLSLYSDRNVPPYLVKNIPFAFAGDPFQTLNPTGFNWNAMQSSFHDNIVQQLDPGGDAKLKFNFQELAFNYRSSEHIVRLGNLVQLLRAVLLRIKGLHPQHCWTRQATGTPVWFRRDDAQCQSALRDQEELVIVIPCQENGELEFVKKDEFLRSVAIRDGEITRNILSPARAKGLEYDRVLLYGFGDEAFERLPDLLAYIAEPDKERPGIEQRLAWEYFLNQFYVAVSRARKRIFIVDSQSSLDTFWSFTYSQKQQDLLDLYDHHDEWTIDELGGIVRGDNSSWTDDRDDPLELALQWRTQGRAQRDPYLLRLAKDNFERADRPEDAKLCEAEQYEFQGDFDKAAKLYVLLGQTESACRCYWAGRNPTAIVNLAVDDPQITNDARFIAASAITRKSNDASQILAVLKVMDNIVPTPFPDMPGELEAWRWFFNCFVESIRDSMLRSQQNRRHWRALIDKLIHTIDRFELPLNAYPRIAELLYLCEDSLAALDHWNRFFSEHRFDPDNDGWLLRARAEAEPYPANIHAYYNLGDHAAVVDNWIAFGKKVDDEVPLDIILDSAIQLNDLQNIKLLLPSSSDIQLISLILSSFDEHRISAIESELPVALANVLVSRGEWRTLTDFVEHQSVPAGQISSALKKTNLRWPKSVLVAAVVRALSRSAILADASSKAQRYASSFLKDMLIADRGASDQELEFVKSILELIDVEEAGAAFERAFRLTFALEFYEQFIFANRDIYRVLRPSEMQTNFARRRWVICKYRLAEMRDGDGQDRHEAEATKYAKEWKVSITAEPEFPTLTQPKGIDFRKLNNSTKIHSGTQSETKGGKGSHKTLTYETISTSATTSLEYEDVKLTVKILTIKGRIVLTNIETEDQVTCGPTDVSSNDVKVSKDINSDGTIIWQIKEWDLRCAIEKGDNVVRVAFYTTTEVPLKGYALTNV